MRSAKQNKKLVYSAATVPNSVDAYMSGPGTTVESMLERLLSLGTQTDENTISHLLKRKDEAIPLLRGLIEKEESWDLESSSYSTWAPICAIHLLAAMGGGKESASVVSNVIREYYEETGDWITEDAASVLAAFGADAFDVISGMVLDQSLEEFCRSAAARALLMISGKDHEIKQRSIEVLKKTISKEKENSSNPNRLAISLLADDLCEFKDPNSLDFIRSLFQANLIDPQDLTYEEVLDVYAGKYDDLGHGIPRNPLDIFAREQGNLYWRTDKSPWMNREKIGRNELCPCGSGKKYKKCCMVLFPSSS